MEHSWIKPVPAEAHMKHILDAYCPSCEIAIPLEKLYSPEFINWLKCYLCMQTMKEGIEKITEAIAKMVFRDVQNEVKHARTCSCCVSLDDIKTCRTKICKPLKDKLDGYWTIKEKSVYKNKNATCKLHSNNLWWELAFWFMPDSPRKPQSPAYADCTALLSYMSNCTKWTEVVGKTTSVTEARDARNDIVHCGTMQIKQSDLEEYTGKFMAVLQELSARVRGKGQKQHIEEARIKIKEIVQNCIDLKLYNEKGPGVFDDHFQQVEDRLEKIREKVQTSINKDHLDQLKRELRQTLSQKYGIGKSTVSDMLKKKATYLEQWENNADSKKTRFSYASKHENINDMVWQWFSRARAKNLPVSGPLLQEKAMDYASELGLSDFKASSGWLEKWKKRFSVKGFKLCGESAGVNEETVSEYKDRISDITSGYSSEDIFNCDETGLYFRALSNKTLAVKGSETSGAKVSKDRVTVLLACSATGEKLKPLVIGKAANPRCMKNVKRDKLGVDYVANAKAWMTGSIFNDWLKQINRMMRLQGRKILMFLDNAGSHGHNQNLSHVELKFLPPNTTSHLQPLDQGVIQTLKVLYRKNLTRSLLSVIDTAEGAQDLCKRVNLLDCIKWITQAWKDVKPSTIQGCFKKAGFCNESSDCMSVDEDCEDDDDVPLAVLARQLALGAEEIVSIDDNIQTEAEPNDWEKDLLSSYKEKVAQEDSDINSEEVSDNEEESEPLPGSELTHRNVLDMAMRLTNFAMCKDEKYLELAQKLQSLTEKTLVKLKCADQQTVITSFFCEK